MNRACHSTETGVGFWRGGNLCVPTKSNQFISTKQQGWEHHNLLKSHYRNLANIKSTIPRQSRPARKDSHFSRNSLLPSKGGMQSNQGNYNNALMSHVGCNNRQLESRFEMTPNHSLHLGIAASENQNGTDNMLSREDAITLNASLNHLPPIQRKFEAGVGKDVGRDHGHLARNIRLEHSHSSMISEGNKVENRPRKREFKVRRGRTRFPMQRDNSKETPIHAGGKDCLREFSHNQIYFDTGYSCSSLPEENDGDTVATNTLSHHHVSSKPSDIFKQQSVKTFRDLFGSDQLNESSVKSELHSSAGSEGDLKKTNEGPESSLTICQTSMGNVEEDRGVKSPLAMSRAFFSLPVLQTQAHQLIILPEEYDQENSATSSLWGNTPTEMSRKCNLSDFATASGGSTPNIGSVLTSLSDDNSATT